MNIIKKLVFACIFVLTLTAGKCFVISSFDSSDNDRDDEGLTIGITNAETANREVMQSLSQTFTVAEITNQSAQYVGDMYSSDTLTVSCENNGGTITINSDDNDPLKNNSIAKENEFFCSYKNCNFHGSVINGDLKITALESKGIDVGHFESGTNWSLKFVAHADSLEISTQYDQMIVNGDISVTLEFDAQSAMLTNKIENEILDLESKTRRILQNINVAQTINLAVLPANYTFGIESLILSSNNLDGNIQATANSNLFTGDEIIKSKEYFIDLYSPRNGMLYISGENSNVEMLVTPGDQVTIGVDHNGDSITDFEMYTTWENIM